MTTQTELKEVLDTLKRIQLLQDTLLHRVTRIESRLTQLMIYEGMQSDGRSEILTQHRGHYVRGT